MQKWTLLTRAAVGLALSCINANGAFQDNRPMPRVRGIDPVTRRLLHDAAERSPTFRHLIDVVNRTDGIVYIEPGACKHVRACLLMSVTIAWPNRVLHIRVDTRDDVPAVVAAIGHELQHAAEALSEAGVRSDGLIEAFFERRSGNPSSRGQLEFETDAAIKAGDAVLLDIMAYRRNRHVRSNDGKVLELIERGEIRSETFWHLLDALDGTDVIVYVEPKAKLRGFGGYLVHHITVAGEQRYLRAVVKSPGSVDELTALVAHQLQHAREVAEALGVHDDDGLRRFFERSGQTFDCGDEHECYETQAANDIQRAVAEELRVSSDRAVRR